MKRFFLRTVFLLVGFGDAVFSQTCPRSNCKKTDGDFNVEYSSFTKTDDEKFPLWTANETISVTGKYNFDKFKLKQKTDLVYDVN